MFLICAICRICDIIFMRRTDEAAGHRALKTQLRSTMSHSVAPSGVGVGGCVHTYAQMCTFSP